MDELYELMVYEQFSADDHQIVRLNYEPTTMKWCERMGSMWAATFPEDIVMLVPA